MSSPLSADLIGELVDAGSREHYTDAALYDYEYRRRRADVAFYRELATQRLGDGGHILELGAGSGRVTIALARAGFHVTAVDSSKAMLAKLRERLAALPRRIAERVTIVEADLRNFEIHAHLVATSSADATRPTAKTARATASARAQFPLAIAVFNVLEHLYTRVELDACLRCVRAHLAPGGAFAFDVQLPDLAWLLRDPWTRWARTKFTDPTTGRQMIYSTNHEYDPISQIVLIRLYYEVAGSEGEGPIKIVKLSQRKFFPAELEALVAHAGLRTVERYGDFGWRPLEAGAESQVLVCEVAAPPPSQQRTDGSLSSSTTKHAVDNRARQRSPDENTAISSKPGKSTAISSKSSGESTARTSSKRSRDENKAISSTSRAENTARTSSKRSRVENTAVSSKSPDGNETSSKKRSGAAKRSVPSRSHRRTSRPRRSGDSSSRNR